MNPILEAFRELNNISGSFRLAHWNVVGPGFYEAHILYQRIYELLYESIDPFAEQIRGLGLEISASALNSITEIQWREIHDLNQHLLAKTQVYVLELEDARKQAQEMNNIGLVALIENMLMDANTIQYLLRSAISD